MICSGCGGVLGRDCWNEHECMEISRQNAHDDYIQQMEYRELEGLWNEIAELQGKVNALEEIMTSYNIPLPYEKPSVSFNESEDWLPF